jgi:hypothetical protein
LHNAPSSPLFENVNRLAAGRGHCATAGSEKRAAAEAIMRRLVERRARCQRQTNSFVTPMGDEMFYYTPGGVSRPSVPNLQMRCANSPLDRYVLTVTVELEGSGAEGAHEER